MAALYNRCEKEKGSQSKGKLTNAQTGVVAVTV